MQPTRLINFTTRYVAREDRIIVSAIGADEQQYELILTRRLLSRLLPKTYSLLLKHQTDSEDKQTSTSLSVAAQSQAARKQTKPVEASKEETSVLVDNASFRALEKGLILTFSDTEEEHQKYEIVFSYSNYESWLSIIQRLCSTAEWPLNDFFPTTVEQSDNKRTKVH